MSGQTIGWRTDPVSGTNEGKAHRLGSSFYNKDGEKFVYIQASADIEARDAVGYSEAYAGAPLTGAMLDDNWGVGWAEAAFSTGDRGYIKCSGNISGAFDGTSSGVDVLLMPSGTPGVLTDGVTNQTFLRGVTITTAAGTTAEVVASLFVPERATSSAF